MISPIIAITNKQIVKNSKKEYWICNIPKTLMNTMPKTVPNTVRNMEATVIAIPKKESEEIWSHDQASDTDIRALVVDILIPEYQRLSVEEQFEENFTLLY